jgi:GNAT superfamily N-acetyltransferase
LEELNKILEEMRPLHKAHWDEKEEEPGRPAFHPDYDTFIRYELAGRALVFTAREEGRLIGNFSLYLQPSMHTQALLATEDTLYLVPEARKGRTAARLIGFAEQAMKKLGVTEISVSVKIDNKHGRYFQMLGYGHVSNGLTKLLES